MVEKILDVRYSIFNFSSQHSISDNINDDVFIERTLDSVDNGRLTNTVEYRSAGSGRLRYNRR